MAYTFTMTLTVDTDSIVDADRIAHEVADHVTLAGITGAGFGRVALAVDVPAEETNDDVLARYTCIAARTASDLSLTADTTLQVTDDTGVMWRCHGRTGYRWPIRN